MTQRSRWLGGLRRPRTLSHLLALLALPVALAVLPKGAESRLPLAAPATPEMLPVEADVGTCSPGEATPGEWVFLSDLPWRAATSGWQAVADVAEPERNVSFSRHPIVLSGTTYEKGLLTHPFSEVVYDLGGRYTALQAQLGLDDEAPAGAAAVFLVYADDALIYNSGAISADAPPDPLDLCVATVQQLRLVTALAGQRAPGAEHRSLALAGGYVSWAEARIFRSAAPAPPVAPALREQLNAAADARWERIVGELGAYRQQAAAEYLAVAGALGLPAQAGEWPAQTQAIRDATGRLVLAHRRLAIAFGFGGPDHAALTAIDPSSGALVIAGASSAVTTAAGSVDLAGSTEPAAPDAYTLGRIDDPVLGPGAEARATLRLRQAPDTTVEVRVALFDDQPYFTYQLVLTGWPSAERNVPISRPGPTAMPSPGGRSEQPQPLLPPTRLDYLSAANVSLVLGNSVRYFSDASYVREAELADDGLWRSVRLGIGKPAFVWGDARPGGVVLALLDEQRLPAWLVARRDPGRAGAAVGISQPLLVRGAAAQRLSAESGTTAQGAEADATPTPAAGARPAVRPLNPVVGPRLLVDVTGTTDLREALADYRRISAALWPPAPLPEWVRYQWGSWWVYGSGLDEEKLRAQIDLIADYLSDLGPWHILIDGAWQDLGWEGSDDLRHEDPQKFPHGLRALVDYAHARGIRVVLLYSSVYAHDGSGFGEWLSVPWLIEEHPDWFIRLAPPGATSSSYLFDYKQPEAREYLASVLTSYVTTYDADGVKIDGLGDVEGQLIPISERVRYFRNRWMLTPVMDIYRLVAQSVWSAKPDAFIESGWVNPAPAHPYAHTFRFGDELDRFRNDYPFPGLLQHFDYAAVQQGVLGQRAHIGTIFGGFNRPLADQWLGAALALGAQVSLGSDLNFVSPEGFAALRALLVPYRPFAGVTRTGPQHFGLHPSWAATTVGDLTFLGLMNREQTARQIEVPLAEVGIAAADAGGADVSYPRATPEPAPEVLAYDVTAGSFARIRDLLSVEVPAQTFRLFVLRRTPGVVWTTSSYEEQPQPGRWRVLVRGPAKVRGELQFHLPGRAPSSVLLDGRPLRRLTPGVIEGYSYDPATAVLTLRYAHAGLGPAPGQPIPARTIDIRR